MPRELRGFLPVADASIRIGITRDRLVRRIQTRQLNGRLIDGKYYVAESDVERLACERASTAVEP